MHRDDKNYQDAIILLRRVLNIDEASEDGLINLAICLLESDTDIGDVEPLLRNAIAINPKNILALNTLANHHKDLEKYRSAKVLYRQVISLDPKFAVGYNNLGTMLMEQDKISQAISMFELSLTLDENQNDVRKNLAIALKYDGNTEGSERQLWKVIKGNPFDTEAYRHLTSISHFTMDDEFTKKIQNLLLTENLTHKQLADLNFALATICESNQKYGEAYRHYLKSNRARRLDLEYSFEEDIKCFDEARNLQIKLNAVKESINSMDDNSIHPIFIIGMPHWYNFS